MSFERTVIFSPAFDKRDPDPKKNYGIHGVELRMVLKGELGATQFLLFTNWQLPHVTAELDAKARPDNMFLYHPSPADLGYHSLKPIYEDQKTMGPCQFLDGKDCYYDGSGLNAERIYDVLVREGSDGVWRELEDFYNEIFNVEHEHA